MSTKRPLKIYLACPYTDPNPEIRAERNDRVTAFCAELLNAGHIVFSPITYTHHMAQAHTMPTTWEFWHTLDVSFIAWAEELWVLTLPGWERSTGVAAEIEEARRLDKAVRYV